jgi:UDP:flavonoid glycosyltransferase YjiC (YdhE family)
MNACIGIAQVLRDRGHTIVFAMIHIWRQKLKIYNFQQEIIEIEDIKTNEDPAKHWSEVVERSGLMGSLTTLQKNEGFKQ